MPSLARPYQDALDPKPMIRSHFLQTYAKWGLQKVVLSCTTLRSLLVTISPHSGHLPIG